MFENTRLSYSEIGNFNRYQMLANNLCIDLIVEDANNEYIYELILKRLYGSNKILDLVNVIGVGGKNNVVKICESENDNPSFKRKVFLMDGDFDRYVYPEKMLEYDNVLYLDAYNIENYFIDEEACVYFIQVVKKLRDKDARELLVFSFWKDRIVKESKDLYLAFACNIKYSLGLRDLDKMKREFLDVGTGFKKNGKDIDTYMRENITNYEKKKQEIIEIYNKINGDDFFNLICGKYLLKSLWLYMQCKCDCTKISESNFKMELVKEFDVKKLGSLKQIIDNNI